MSKKRRGIGGGSGAGGSPPSSSRRDRGLAVDFKESQVRGASTFLCFYTLQVAHTLSSVWIVCCGWGFVCSNY